MAGDDGDRQLQGYARLAGGMYLLQNVTFFASLIIMSRMIVAGDLAVTARNIAASETLYRVGVAIGLVASPTTIFLAGAFYLLLKRVDAGLALFGLLFRVAEGILYGVIYLLVFTALDISRGGAHGLAPAGQQALWNLVSRAEQAGGTISSVYFCFGAMLFFYLLLRARFIPRILSLFALVMAVLVLMTLFATVIAPPLGAKLQVIGLPLAAAEILMGLWLLIAGANLEFWRGAHPRPIQA